jgi:VWFA-related protein
MAMNMAEVARRCPVHTALRAPVLLVLVCSLACIRPVAAAPQGDPQFSAEASAVVLDVVVRDSAGRPVVGLGRDDFEVFEERKRQPITLFEGPAVRGASGAAPPVPGAAAGAAAFTLATPPRVVAIVFEQLGPSARLSAVAAARRLLGSLSERDFVGVFAVDRSVHVLQNYAVPDDAVQAALDAAAERPGSPLRRAGVVPGAEFGDVERGAPTQETRDEAKRTRGMATFDALTQIVRGLALLPGRKMVVLFSEGFALDASEEVAQITRADGPRTMDDTWLTDGRFERFQRLLEQANAAQVTFYTFDAAGLRLENPFAKSGFGRAPHVGLLALAEGTGGAFVENTNDLAPGAVRAAEDHASYYVLGYTPSKPPDGEYRSLSVRARCEGCRVLARRGYRALPSRELRQVGVRDVAPFLLLDGRARHTDLPVGWDVRTRSRQNVEVTATLDEAAATAGGLVTFMARITDTKGKAIAVVSQHFELRGPATRGAVLRLSRVLPVPPGRLTIELVVYDHASRRATVLSRAYDPSQ